MPEGLLEPRLYRAAFAPALLALIILAFSLQDPARSMAPELSPPGFSAQRAELFAQQAVSNYGARESGSTGDNRLADLVDARMQGVGFRVSRTSFTATTLHGSRRLTNVIAVRPGPSDRRLLVIASRDGAPGKLEKAGSLETGMLLELARVLQGRAFDHTIVLASVSGGVDGGLGAQKVAQSLRGPIDATIVLRNIGALPSATPVLSEYDSRISPDASYERTLRRIATLELGGAGDRRGVGAQLVRLGFPLALGEQATLPAAGLNAAALSPGGEPLGAPMGDSVQQVRASGQTTLRALTTFDQSFRPAAPAATPLRVGGKLIPQWALVLLIGALLFPLVVASIDAWARARRWGQLSQRGLIAPALAFVWLVVLAFLLRGVALSGAIDAPPLAPDPSAVSGAGPVAVGLFFLVFALLGMLVAAAATRQATPKGGEAGFALWIVFTGVAVFVINPVAAGFLLLLLHLVVLTLLTGGARRSRVATLVAIGLLPLIAAAVYYPVVFGLSAIGSLRYAVLLEAGGYIGPLAIAGACLVVATIGTAVIQLFWSAPRPRPDNGFAPRRSPLDPV